MVYPFLPYNIYGAIWYQVMFFFFVIFKFCSFLFWLTVLYFKIIVEYYPREKQMQKIQVLMLVLCRLWFLTGERDGILLLPTTQILYFPSVKFRYYFSPAEKFTVFWLNQHLCDNVLHLPQLCIHERLVANA